MYYLSAVKIFAKGTNTKVPYPEETDDIQVIDENTIAASHIKVDFNRWVPISDESFIAFFHSNGLERLGTFKKRLNKQIKKLLLPTFANCYYEASIYPLKHFKNLVFWAWYLRIEEETVVSPAYLSPINILNYTYSATPEDLSKFQIIWKY